jgi:hypothetical protein
MKILDMQGNEILNPDLTKGHLEPDKLTIHHDAVTAVEEQSHIEVIKEYENGGKDVEKIIDVPGILGCDAYDTFEDIERYIPYTASELETIEKQKSTPTLAERISALEQMQLSEIIGGDS